MKNILVLAREDTDEAMRVAAGLTIFGHQVGCVFTGADWSISADNENLEMLELADVEPQCLAANDSTIKVISSEQLGQQIRAADTVLSF